MCLRIDKAGPWVVYRQKVTTSLGIRLYLYFPFLSLLQSYFFGLFQKSPSTFNYLRRLAEHQTA